MNEPTVVAEEDIGEVAFRAGPTGGVRVGSKCLYRSTYLSLPEQVTNERSSVIFSPSPEPYGAGAPSHAPEPVRVLRTEQPCGSILDDVTGSQDCLLT